MSEEEIAEELKDLLSTTPYEGLSIVELIVTLVNDVQAYENKEAIVKIEREAEQERQATLAAVEKMAATWNV